MGVFEMVVILVFIATAGKLGSAWITGSARGLDAGAEKRIRQLEAELRANEERLALTEDRVVELSEKLGFVENLLASPRETTELPPSRR